MGDGLYAGDRVKTTIELQNSSLLLTSESATKVYPSQKNFAINSYHIDLTASNFEFINDELILYPESRYKQNLHLTYDKTSTFFYVDILSSGPANQSYLYNAIHVQNIFYNSRTKEYKENYKLKADHIKNYLQRAKSKDALFVKFYIKSPDNQKFISVLNAHEFFSFAFTKSMDLLIGAYAYKRMSQLKAFVFKVWALYREQLGKGKCDLGKY